MNAGLDGICWVITKWIAHPTGASVLGVVSLPFRSFSQQTSERARRSKQEWLNDDEERVECAIHFVITLQIPSNPAVTLKRRMQ